MLHADMWGHICTSYAPAQMECWNQTLENRSETVSAQNLLVTCALPSLSIIVVDGYAALGGLVGRGQRTPGYMAVITGFAGNLAGESPLRSGKT